MATEAQVEATFEAVESIQEHLAGLTLHHERYRVTVSMAEPIREKYAAELATAIARVDLSLERLRRISR